METPLAACLDLPGNGARKRAVAVGGNSLWCNFSSGPRQRRQKKSLMACNSHVRWEPQEEGMMRTVASFPSERNQGLIEPGGAKKHVEG